MIESPRFIWKSFLATTFIVTTMLSIFLVLRSVKETQVQLDFLRAKFDSEISMLKLKQNEQRVKQDKAVTDEYGKKIQELIQRQATESGRVIESKRIELVGSILIALIVGIIVYPTILGLQKSIYRFSSKLEKIEFISAEANRLQEELPLDFFSNLVKLNFKYLDAYYLQTQVQADKSFLLAVAAAIISLLIIIFGIVLMLFKQTDPGNVTIAAGAVGEVMAAIFFYLYNRTVMKMGEYHQKLVLTQNIGLALKIAESLEGEKRVQAHCELIQALVKDINQHLASSSPA